MNTIKIYLAESGGIANLVKDFSVYQYSYQNKLLNIFVPTSILAPDFISQLNGVTTGEYVAGTAVKIGMSYTARNGSIKTSESRYLNYIKVLKYQNVEYALFERMLPKEFTLYAGQGANAPILTTNVVNVQTDVEEGETPIVLSIITSQTCNLEVMASTILDNEEVVEASELETINARLNSIDGTLAEKQDITDEALDTTSKTIVGGINELKATSDTHTTQIGDNTEDIAENQNDIDYLYSHMAQPEEYIGQMTGSALPSDSALTDFVVANTDPSRQPKNADVIIFILQVPDGTDKNYKYLFSVTSWNGFEIPPVEEASNGTKGILEGTYSVGLTHNTLVNISGGQILNIYVKDTTGTYRDIREYANTLNTTIQSIIAGDTSVGLAVKSLQDGLGNNIVNTYLTQNAGATKQYVRDYSLPREFNDIYFIASTGYQDTIPTTPESGIQFSGTSSAVGDLTLFQIEKVSVADFELSSKNSSQNTIYVSADRNCSVYFRLSTQAKNIGQDWVDLSVELSNQISLTSGEIYKLTFSSAFSSLGTTVMTLTDNDLIRQTFEVVTQESAETTFDVYSNETYTSSYAMNTQSQVQIIAQGNLGEQPVYEIAGELVGGVITFELDDPTILNNNVEARFVLNYTTATVPEDSTEIALVLNEQNIRLVTPYNLDTGNAIVRYLSQVNNQFTGGVQTWAFKGFIQIDGGDNISIIVDEDDVSLKVDKEFSTDYVYTEGLVFSWDTDHYRVGRYRTPFTGTETNIIIPKYYDDGTHGVALVTELYEGAFENNTSIISVSLPDSIIRSYSDVFRGCTNLKSITFPEKWVDMGLMNFYGCSSLSTVKLNENMTTFGGQSFQNCSALEEIIIPKNITSMNNSTFIYCSNLTKIYMMSQTPPTTDAFVFLGSGITATTGAIYVPYESLTAYKTATGWSTFADVIYPIPDGKDLTNKLGLKVDKVAGKALSTNDLTNTLKSNYDTAYTNTHTHSNKTILDNTTASYTTAEQTKLLGISGGAQVNVIEEIKVNNTALIPTAKSVNITIPVQASDVNALPDTTKYGATIDLSYTANTGVLGLVLKDQDGTQISSDAVDLPLELLIESGSVKTCTVINTPVAGYVVGDKYIDLVLANSNHIYIKVSDLIDQVTITETGTGNAVTDISISGNTITETKGKTFVETNRTVNGHALSSDITITKSDVDLANVDNTSDANKPVSTAQATAIALKLDKTTTGSVRRVYGVNASNEQELTEIETTPIASSTKLVTSGGIKTALNAKANFVDFGDTLISSSSWVSSNGDVYEQVVNVSGVLATDRLDIDLNLIGVVYKLEIDAKLTAWSKIYRAESLNGRIKFYATEIPTESISVNIKVVR